MGNGGEPAAPPQLCAGAVRHATREVAPGRPPDAADLNPLSDFGAGRPDNGRIRPLPAGPSRPAAGWNSDTAADTPGAPAAPGGPPGAGFVKPAGRIAMMEGSAWRRFRESAQEIGDPRRGRAGAGHQQRDRGGHHPLHPGGRRGRGHPGRLRVADAGQHRPRGAARRSRRSAASTSGAGPTSASRAPIRPTTRTRSRAPSSRCCG